VTSALGWFCFGSAGSAAGVEGCVSADGVVVDGVISVGIGVNSCVGSDSVGAVNAGVDVTATLQADNRNMVILMNRNLNTDIEFFTPQL
jgi:hypothetical protein